MKKAAILTIHSMFLFTNYGSFLQHWALRKALSSLDIFTSRFADTKHPATDRKQFFKDLFKISCCVFLHYMKFPQYRSSNYSSRQFRKYITQIKFELDYKKHIGPINEIQTMSDVVIVGGDQVFNPQRIHSALSITARRHIVYAASADWTKAAYSSEWQDGILNFINGFEAIGLRENAGVDLLKSIGCRKKIEHVADPVMLMTRKQYQELACAKRVFKTDTVFVYLLNIHNASSIGFDDISSIATSYNCAVKFNAIQGADMLIPSDSYVSLSPSEFVKAYIDAKCIITNSYHGTLLAIILHKPFISIKQKFVKGANQNTRQQELLSWLGLGDHRISMDDLCTCGQHLLAQTINWEGIDKRIEDFRNFSMSWLKEAVYN